MLEMDRSEKMGVLPDDSTAVVSGLPPVPGVLVKLAGGFEGLCLPVKEVL